MAHILAESSNACPFPTIDLFDWNISSLGLFDILAKQFCQNTDKTFFVKKNHLKKPRLLLKDLHF